MKKNTSKSSEKTEKNRNKLTNHHHAYNPKGETFTDQIEYYFPTGGFNPVTYKKCDDSRPGKHHK